jgi:hypothetical protein
MKLEATPITAELQREYTFADNLLQDAVRGLGLIRRMRRLGIGKRSGDGAAQVVFASV